MTKLDDGIDRKADFTGTGEVKEAHRFDIDALDKYLLAHVEGFKGPLQVQQFKGGQSNPTYLLNTPDKKYVLRRKPPGQLLKSAHAVDREYKVMTGLGQTNVPVPKTYCLCKDETVIGTWFFVMGYADGRIIWDVTVDEFSADQRGELYTSMNKTIAALHAVDFSAVGLGDYGRTENYVARQVGRWSKQYLASVDNRISAMDRLVEWLPANMPEDDGDASIVHGDFRIDNMVFDNGSSDILAILDWELSTLGHPIADFSYHCMQWRLPKGLFGGMQGMDLDALGIPQEQDYVQRYCQNSGRESLAHWDFYMVYNMFRMAAIFHGIAGRVKIGTAASSKAIEMGALAQPIAEVAWQQVETRF